MDYRDKLKQAYAEVSGVHGLSLADMSKVRRPLPSQGDRWGNWEYDAKNFVLEYVENDGSHGYQVGLDDMTTSAQMLDWIFQVCVKTWVTQKDKGDLIDALQDLLHPQGTLCSGGQGKTLDATKLLMGYAEQVTKDKI